MRFFFAVLQQRVEKVHHTYELLDFKQATYLGFRMQLGLNDKSHTSLLRIVGTTLVRLQMTTSEKTTKKGENDEHTKNDDDDSKEESKEFMREKEDRYENPMPPFPIKSPTEWGTNDLPSMRKELRMQLQLAIKATREKGTTREEEEDKEENKKGEKDKEERKNDDEIGTLANALEGLVAVADGNLSLLITGDANFASTRFAFECIEKMDPQRVSVTIAPGFTNTREFDVIIIFVDSERVLEVVEETKLVVKRVGSENVFIAAFVKEDAEEEGEGGEEEEGEAEGEMRAALESVRSSDLGVMPSSSMPTAEEDEEYSDAQIEILRNARGTKRDVEKNAASIPELSSRDVITEFERQTLAIEPIEMRETTTSTTSTTKMMNSPKKSPKGGGQSPMKISFPSDEGNEDAKQELFLRAEALLWNIALSSGIDPSNACAFEHGGKNNTTKNIMTFHRREQIEWVKEIERALEKIEEARLRQVKSQLANVYVEASGLDAVEVGLISPEKRGKRENLE